jgi:hypothetical protein
LAAGEVTYASARKELSDGQGELSGPSEEELAENRRKAEELEKRAKEAEAARSAAEAKAAEELRQREDEYRAQMEAMQKDWDSKLRDREEANASGEAAAAEQAKNHAVELEKMQREFEERQRAAEEASQRRIEELERKAAKAAAEEEDHRQHELNMRKLEEQLMFVMPLVKEANLLAAELQRPHRLETRMQVELSGERSRGTIRVTAAVSQDNIRLYEWTPETLENRVFLLRELLQRCEEEGLEAASSLRNEEDPLWDPVEVERLIGVAQVLLEGLLLQVENQLDARILSTDGHQSGTLRVELWPVSKDGTPGIPDEEVVDEQEELLGSKMTILLKVPNATGLPEALANDVRVEFDYFIDAKPYQVPRVDGRNRDPKFDFTQTFVQDPVTSRFLEYLRTKTLVFRVYGRDTAAEKKLQDAEVEAAAAAEAAAKAAAEAELRPKSAAQFGIDGVEDSPPADGAALASPMAVPPAAPPTASPEPPLAEPPMAEKQETPKAKAPSLASVRREQEKAETEMQQREEPLKKQKSKYCSVM